MKVKEVIKYFIDKIVYTDESKDRKKNKLKKLKIIIHNYFQVSSTVSLNYFIDNKIDLTLYDSLNRIDCQIKQKLLKEIDKAINDL